jgi:hypothetical protein
MVCGALQQATSWNLREVAFSAASKLAHSAEIKEILESFFFACTLGLLPCL